MDISPKGIAILGSTGSIGTQTLDIIARFPKRYRVMTLIAGRRVEELIAQAIKFRPARAIIADESLYSILRDALAPLGIETMAGENAIASAMEADDTQMVVTATVGYSGLIPTIHAIQAGKEIALANKETLVVAGELVTNMLRSSDSVIYPVDSEHSAIRQCLAGEEHSAIRRLLITASGGPFRTLNARQLANVTAAQALKHPKWEMGAKITIDSATMLNKAFEIIEAHWLFDIPAGQISAVVHPQSIVHSMVEFTDGAFKAQLGVPDMHLPISYALGCDTRLADVEKPLSLADFASLTFEAPDTDKFPCLTLAGVAMERGGNTACIINAANEIANEAFRSGLIRFTDIYPIIIKTIEQVDFIPSPSLDDYIATNAQARAVALNLIK